MEKKVNGWVIDTEKKTMSCYGLTIDNVCGTYELLYGDPMDDTGPLAVLFTQTADPMTQAFDFDVLYFRKKGEWWAVDKVSWLPGLPELRKLDYNPVERFIEELQKVMIELSLKG